MTGITALLLLIGWTMLLALSYATYRIPQIFLAGKPANHWERTQPVDDPPLLIRTKGAHLNALENIPLFAALVLIAATTGQSAVVDGLAGYFLAARVAQSLAHILGTSMPLVMMRATFFLAQIGMMFYMVWALLSGV